MIYYPQTGQYFSECREVFDMAWSYLIILILMASTMYFVSEEYIKGNISKKFFCTVCILEGIAATICAILFFISLF